MGPSTFSQVVVRQRSTRFKKTAAGYEIVVFKPSSVACFLRSADGRDANQTLEHTQGDWFWSGNVPKVDVS